MLMWPRSGWTHAVIAFLGATIAAWLVSGWVGKARLALYVRQYPHDGQDGLGAMIDSLIAGAGTLICVFVVLFAIQRVYTRH